MKIKDLSTVFGISVEELIKHGKRYRICIWLLYLFDAIAIFGSTAYMFFHGVQYQWYWYALVIICVVVNLVFDRFMGVEKYNVYRFYKKNQNVTVDELKYRVTWVDVHDVLSNLGMKPGGDDSIETMLNNVQLACQKNVKMARRFMAKFDKHEAPCGRITCQVARAGDKKYFINIVAIEVAENKEGE